MAKFSFKASAIAHPNFALTKYWGKHPGFDSSDNVPPNDRISMVASADDSYEQTQLETRTTVHFSDKYDDVNIHLNKEPINKDSRVRKVVNKMLKDAVAEGRIDQHKLQLGYRVESINDFPTKAGLASSASGFSALVKAIDEALSLGYTESELALYAMKGSGSAVGSIHSGIVDCKVPSFEDKDPSINELNIESLDEGENLDWSMIVAVVNSREKEVGSSKGHKGAETSFYHRHRVKSSNKNAAEIRKIIRAREDKFELLGELAERDAIMMHNVMRTQDNPLIYDTENTVKLKNKISKERSKNKLIYWTQDAGPNLKIIVRNQDKDYLRQKIKSWNEVKEAIPVNMGQGARSTNKNLF